MNGSGAVSPAPLRVASLVNLYWSETAGGHVKCWERIAEAAAGHPEAVDLTVHYLGHEAGVRDLAPNVRYRFHRPAFGTDRLGFLKLVPDHTDLARFHPGLAESLAGCDIVHTTAAGFAFARTAERLCARDGIPLVNSIHTDAAGYARVFSARIIRGIVGARLGVALNRWLGLPRRIEARMARGLHAHQRKCAYALVSKPEDYEAAVAVLGADRIGMLRRGIDTRLFDPARRDRAWLQSTYGIDPDEVVVLYVGRINAGKDVMTLARAVSRLIDEGHRARLFCAGDGEQRATILHDLGAAATCPGILDRETLARVYAAADVFANPSRFEVFGNVVLEALASGLPVLVSAEGGMGRVLAEGRTGWVIAGNDPAAWAETLRGLVASADLRREASRAARAAAETELPTWDAIFAEDILPIWRKAAAERRGEGG